MDSKGEIINIPEKATLFYTNNNYYYDYESEPVKKLPCCTDYKFIGYLYVKTVENRLKNLPHDSYRLLDEIEVHAKHSSEFANKYSCFKNRFFMYPPLPEFFADARNEIKNFYKEITSEATSTKSR